ncbi:ATP-binding protein [Acidocella sp.]|uniref:ATP-binding protein n=1 Tax=Acidocella sp. TaxID=50710 RepID=UPI00261F5175|nr:ATP-binding protein [Acidocella sp.]
MAEPISLEEAKKARRRKARSDDGMTPQDQDGNDDTPCPVTPLGYADGKFWFLNIKGEKRCLTARQLGSRAEIAALFMGEMDWVKRKFEAVDAEGMPRGFSVARAGEYLMNACGGAGMYGDHVIIRRPGVWAGDDGRPIAHCGDAIFIAGEKRAAGVKIGNQIFASAARMPYPALEAAPADVAQGLLSDMARLWTFRDDGAEIIALGLVGQAYYAAALSWRANGFISGASNSGKSQLLGLLNAMAPISHYSNDTTKAGIEGAVDGRAMPSFIDESSDRGAADGAAALLDVVLAASSGSGTKKHRGTADGGVRVVEMIGSVIMASISPPPMQAQHRSRFSIIELLRPPAGADNLEPMQAAIARAKAAAPGLFARALYGFDRYNAALARFRLALGREGCVAREMDQLGAILAGYWVLAHDGAPGEDEAAGIAGDIRAFIRGADEMAEDDGPQLVLMKLLTHVVQLDRSTDTDTVARVIEAAMAPRTFEPGETGDIARARRVLERFGVRAVRADDKDGDTGKPVPRLGQGNGLWINPRAEPLRKVFMGTPYDGERWLFEILRLPSARRSKSSVRIGSVSGKAVWLSWDDISGADDG